MLLTWALWWGALGEITALREITTFGEASALGEVTALGEVAALGSLGDVTALGESSILWSAWWGSLWCLGCVELWCGNGEADQEECYD
jgi:hypothetical protein